MERGRLERGTATRITGRRSKGGWRGEAFIRVISYLYWDSYCGYFGEIVLQRGATRGGALIYEQSRPFRATEITAAGNGSYNRHSECLNKVGRNDRLCNTVTNRPSFDSMCPLAENLPHSGHDYFERKLFSSLYIGRRDDDAALMLLSFSCGYIWKIDAISRKNKDSQWFNDHCYSNFVEFIARKK